MQTIKIPLDQIQQYVESLNMQTISIKDSYTNSYCALLNYFADKDKLTKDDLIVGAHAVYGWMPKILRIDLEKSDVEALNQAKQGIELSPEQLKDLRSRIGNSIIGVSKLLHFINPSQYPMYDTHIYKFLYSTPTKNKGHFYQVNNIKVYQDYAQAMGTAAETEVGNTVRNLVQSMINYDVTPIRALELAMFYMHKAGINAAAKNN